MGDTAITVKDASNASKDVAVFEESGTADSFQKVINGHPVTKCATYNTTASGTDDNVLPALSAGSRYAITRLSVTLDEATTVGVGVLLGFGATTLPALGASQADAVDKLLFSHPGMVPGSGANVGDGGGIIGIGGDGEELRITNDVPTSGRLDVSVSYFVLTP